MLCRGWRTRVSLLSILPFELTPSLEELFRADHLPTSFSSSLSRFQSFLEGSMNLIETTKNSNLPFAKIASSSLPPLPPRSRTHRNLYPPKSPIPCHSSPLPQSHRLYHFNPSQLILSPSVHLEPDLFDLAAASGERAIEGGSIHGSRVIA